MSEAQEEQGVALESPLYDFLSTWNHEDILDLLDDRDTSYILRKLGRVRIGVREYSGDKVAYVEAGARLRAKVTSRIGKYSGPYHIAEVTIDGVTVADGMSTNDAKESLVKALLTLSARTRRARLLLELVGGPSNVESDAPVAIIASNINEVEQLVSIVDGLFTGRRTIGQELDELVRKVNVLAARLDELEDRVDRLDG